MTLRKLTLPALLAAGAVALLAATFLFNGQGVSPVRAAAGLPALPAGWPTTLQLGMSDAPGGAASMKATTSFGFRYQYLAGGVNTGNGWATWNSGGAFVTYYMQDSIANAITPVFTYYQLRQSAPGNSQAEAAGDLANLNNLSTMTAYYNDLKLFFQKAGAFPSTMAVLQVEPDLWGYIEQAATNDDAATVPAQVASTGLPELAGLPNTVPGFAQAILRLRNQYAPNVRVGYHLSYWGTGTDPLYAKPSMPQVDALATRSATFYRSLKTPFDVSFAEFSDRDSGFYQYVYGNPNTWWTAADFARNVEYLATFSSLSQTRIVMWQIPLGNTIMRAEDNTWGHYQDNRPQWLLDDPGRTNLTAYANAGVVAFLFGGGAAGTTCACDAQNDGITNPPPIDGNTTLSLSADDDGGYFRAKAKAYYTAGPLPLPNGSSPLPTPTSSPTPVPTNTSTPTPTATRTATPTATATRTATPAPTKTAVPTATPTRTPSPVPTATRTTVPPGWSTGGSASPSTVHAGQTEKVTATVRSNTALKALVDVEVYDPNWNKVFQKYYDNQSFTAGAIKSFSASWKVPTGAAKGSYHVMIGVFSPGWGTLYSWNSAAATFTVN